MDDEEQRHIRCGGPSDRSDVVLSEYQQVADFDQALRLEDRVKRLLGPSPSLPRQGASHAVATDDAEPWRWPWEFVVGLDVGYATTSSEKDAAVAVAVLYDVSKKAIVDHESQSFSSSSIPLPYKASFLAFREVPLLADVAERLMKRNERSLGDKRENVILVCDGNGTLHPRKCGSACHLGILLDCPSIGVAKNYHVGMIRPSSPQPSQDPLDTHGRSALQELESQRGARLPLYLDPNDELPIGVVVRTQTDVKPIFVSSGNAIALDDACDVILHLCTQFRQPEPIRSADHIGRAALRRSRLASHSAQS